VNDIVLEGTKTEYQFTENGYVHPRNEKSGSSLETQIKYFEETVVWSGVNDTHIQFLRDFFGFDTEQTRIIILEMPMDPLIFSVIPRSVRTNSIFETMLKTETGAAGIPFWHLEDPIPTNGWFDLIHLNTAGAQYFSRAVGTFLGDLLPDGVLRPTTGNGVSVR
jgi:hypothetical protein